MTYFAEEGCPWVIISGINPHFTFEEEALHEGEGTLEVMPHFFHPIAEVLCCDRGYYWVCVMKRRTIWPSLRPAAHAQM